MAATPKNDEPVTDPERSAKNPPRFAKLRRFLWDWQEIGHVAFFLAGAITAVFLSRLFGENAGQTPWSFIADLGQLAAATSLCALLAWLVKRALIGDLTEGEVGAAKHHIRSGSPHQDGYRFLLKIDAAGSVACLLLVVLLWFALY